MKEKTVTTLPQPTKKETTFGLLQDFKDLVAKLDRLKPNDRSEADRYWAIVRTDLQRVQAEFYAWIGNEEF